MTCPLRSGTAGHRPFRLARPLDPALCFIPIWPLECEFLLGAAHSGPRLGVPQASSLWGLVSCWTCCLDASCLGTCPRLFIFCRLFPIWSGRKRLGEKSATISLLPSFEIRLWEIKGWKSDIFVFFPSTALSETKEIFDNPPCRNYGRSQMAFSETGSFFLYKIGKIK